MSKIKSHAAPHLLGQAAASCFHMLLAERCRSLGLMVKTLDTAVCEPLYRYQIDRIAALHVFHCLQKRRSTAEVRGHREVLRPP